MAGNRQYDHEYKVQALKLAKESGQAKAAKELGVPRNTLYGWVHANRLGKRAPKVWYTTKYEQRRWKVPR